MYFDSHCHLTYDGLAADFNGVLQRAGESGVTRCLNIGDNLVSSKRALEQAHMANESGVAVWATVGVHPQHALEYDDATRDQLRALAADGLVRGIGEIGLDFLYDDTHPQFPGASRPVQENVLRDQLQLAIELRLPVVIHNRHADEALLRVMADYHAALPGGVFHCFGSAPDVARQVLNLGFHLGFGGLVTFKNAGEVREVAQLCPADRLIIETDAPYLAPVPLRGKTNEPSYLPHTAAMLAQVRGISVEEIAALTTGNACRLFAV